MATYNLIIIIDNLIVQRQSSDNLNIARKESRWLVNGEFTTTFTGASINPIGNQQLLQAINNFTWVEEYSVLLTQKHTSGMLVSAATTPQSIAFGQKVDYKKGVLGSASPAPDTAFRQGNIKTSFVLGEVPDNLSAAVATKILNKWATIYVDNSNHMGMIDKELTPKNEYALFFDSYIASGSMIDYSKTTRPYTFSFDNGSHEKVLRFGFQERNKPASVSEQPQWRPDTLF